MAGSRFKAAHTRKEIAFSVFILTPGSAFAFWPQ
jgi:hypothetical protein